MGDTEVTEVFAEELTQQAFQTFGTVLCQEMVADQFADGTVSGGTLAIPQMVLDLPVSADGPTACSLIRYPFTGMLVSRIERHLNVTEIRVALGLPAVVVVAGATSWDERDVPPPSASFRAFIVRKGAGVRLKRGAWHAAATLPLTADRAMFLFVSDKETEAELGGGGPLADLQRTHSLDLDDWGVTLRVVPPTPQSL